MKNFNCVLSTFACLTSFTLVACSNTSAKNTHFNNKNVNNSSKVLQWEKTNGFIGTKNPSEPKEVGDIVFNDGSATPYSVILERNDIDLETVSKVSKTEKDSAIAIIFYKGNGLNNNNDSSTIRTLGVGLKQNKTGLKWCSSNAKGYTESIKSTYCFPEGTNGYYKFSNNKNGKDNLLNIQNWLNNKNKEDDTNSLDNKTLGTFKYPAFKYAENYSSNASNLKSFNDGWYLPSIAELFEIYKCQNNNSYNFDLSELSILLGGDSFSENRYWSSTQSDLYKTKAYCCNFRTGRCDGDNWYKIDESFYVCVIKEF